MSEKDNPFQNLGQEVKSAPPEIPQQIVPESLGTGQTEESGLWEQLLIRLRADANMQLYSLLERCEKHLFTENVLSLTLSQSFDAHSLKDEEKKLITLLNELSGVSFEIKVHLLAPDELESKPDEDEKVEMVRRIFQGQIIRKGESR